jgi:hypothetical protein
LFLASINASSELAIIPQLRFAPQAMKNWWPPS